MRGSPVIAVAGATGLGLLLLAQLNIESQIAGLMPGVGEGHGSIEMVDDGRERVNAQRFDSLLRANPKFAIAVAGAAAKELGIRMDARFDSASPGAPLFMARQLEHIFARVLETPSPATNLLTVFGDVVNTEVAPGARTYTIRRFSETGEAIIWRGGNGIPRVGMAQEEYTRPVRHLVSSFAFDIFESMAANFANVPLVTGLMKACRKAVSQKFNALGWYGDAAADVWGVLTYPFLAKKSVATPFDGSATPDDMIAELNAIVNYAEENSEGVFGSNALLTTSKVRNLLANTPRSSGSDLSVLQWFLKNNTAGITSVETARELQGGTGIPVGSHAILAYKKGDEDAIRLIVPQPFTTLPVQRIGVEDITIAYQSFGGVVMPDVGNNLLAFVTVAA